VAAVRVIATLGGGFTTMQCDQEVLLSCADKLFAAPKTAKIAPGIAMLEARA
jgi:hypothetical protein